ncbi:MAG: hypothetical protein JXB07_11365 [Anaerolineae bacterium]|nr:hypothetical protein [Anaerolineae bacterium]
MKRFLHSETIQPKWWISLVSMACLTLWGCGLGAAVSRTEESTMAAPGSDKFTLVRLEPSDGYLGDLLKVEAQKAQEAKQTPYVEFDADWCPPCRALSVSLSDERMIDAFEGTYIIRLDFDQWESALPKADFYVAGIPAFFEIDAEGKPTGRTITGAAWGEDIPENMAPPLKAFFRGEDAD